jgi:uncharacterized protein
MDIEKLKKEISKRIRENFKVKEIILFGSFAKGSASEDSDIDLIVVLDDERKFNSYDERLDKRLEIAKILYDFNVLLGIDLLVYTKIEWNLLLKSGSQFYNSIFNEGERI